MSCGIDTPRERPVASPANETTASPRAAKRGGCADASFHDQGHRGRPSGPAAARARRRQRAAGRRHPHRRDAADGRRERPEVRPDGQGRVRARQRGRRHQRQEDRGHAAGRRVQARQGHRERQPLHPPAEGAPRPRLDLLVGVAPDGGHHREGGDPADHPALDERQHHPQGQRLGVPRAGVRALLRLGAREVPVRTLASGSPTSSRPMARGSASRRTTSAS